MLSWRTSRAKSLRQEHAWITKGKTGGDCSSSGVNTVEGPSTYVIEVLRSVANVSERFQSSKHLLQDIKIPSALWLSGEKKFLISKLKEQYKAVYFNLFQAAEQFLPMKSFRELLYI